MYIKFMKKLVLITTIVCSLILTGCNSNINDANKEIGNPVSVKIDNAQFTLEVARTKEELERGLMGRASLDQDRGMLFIFNKPDLQVFWMKNTLIPLQIIFVNGCEIVGVQEMAVEQDPSNPTKNYASSAFADKAIELNANSASENIVGKKINELCN